MTSFPSDRHVQRRVTVLCFLLYLPLGLARYNYSACLLALLAAEPFSRAAAGFIGTVSFFAFALGTALSGFVADRASSRRLVFAALLVSALSNLVFYCTRSYAVMLVAWAVNGLSHGPVFSCVMRLLSACYPRERVTGASIAIQCAFFVGMGLAYALSALLIRFCSWREAFLAAAVACAAFAILWNFGLRCADPYTDARQTESPCGSTPDPAAPSAWKLVCGAGLVVVPLSLAVQGILRDGVTAWGRPMWATCFTWMRRSPLPPTWSSHSSAFSASSRRICAPPVSRQRTDHRGRLFRVQRRHADRPSAHIRQKPCALAAAARRVHRLYVRHQRDAAQRRAAAIRRLWQDGRHFGRVQHSGLYGERSVHLRYRHDRHRPWLGSDKRALAAAGRACGRRLSHVGASLAAL